MGALEVFAGIWLVGIFVGFGIITANDDFKDNPWYFQLYSAMFGWILVGACLGLMLNEKEKECKKKP
jgi:hypothetical protein